MSTQPQQTEQLTLSLPYEEITKVANRDYLRKNFTRAPRDSYYIEFEKILERDNFNQRKVYEGIEELAQSILASGLKVPFVLDVLPDDRVFVEEGHRRKRAIQLLIDRKEKGWTGKTLVEFFPNKSDATELNRMVNQYTSNNHKKKLKPYEAAEVAFSVKNNYRRVRSNDEVATLMGVSRQQVDNYILIATASDELKNQMVMADMTLTECLAIIKGVKKLKSQTDKVEEDSHKNTAPPTPFPKDELADEMKELADLDRQAEQMKDELEVDEETGEVRMTNPDLKGYESKGLDLVGNTVAATGKEKDENDVPGAKKFDESREEISWCQNLIKNLDWLSVQSEKLPEQTSKDFVQRCNWLIKDAELIRDWVSKNKKENKRGR